MPTATLVTVERDTDDASLGDPTPTSGIDGLDDRSLARRARTDVEAFAALYRRHLDAIHAFAYRRTGNRDAAEDITAATFEAALRGIDGFDPDRGTFAAWLYSIAANAAVGHHRREARATSDRGRAAALRSQQFVAAGADEAISDLDSLRHALEALTPRHQRAIALRYLARLDPDEAATAMGLSRPAYAVVLSRARTALRRALDRLEEPT